MATPIDVMLKFREIWPKFREIWPTGNR